MEKNKETKTTEPLVPEEPVNNRQYKIPIGYIRALVDRIYTTNPSRGAMENTFKDVYSMGFDNGYQRRIADSRFFKDKRAKRLKETWDEVRTEISDNIYQNK